MEHMEKYMGETYGEVCGWNYGEVHGWNIWRSTWIECMEKYMTGMWVWRQEKEGRSDGIIISKKKNIKRCINLNHPHFRKNNKRKLNTGGKQLLIVSEKA